MDNKLICLIGPSGSGKDSILKGIIEKYSFIKPIVRTTTRPKREHEIDGVHYNFVDDINPKVCIQYEEYNTVFGVWKYGTMWEDINISDQSQIVIINPNSISKIKSSFNEKDVIFLYIHVDDELRYERIYSRFTKDSFSRITMPALYYRPLPTTEKLLSDLTNELMEVRRRDITDQKDYDYIENDIINKNCFWVNNNRELDVTIKSIEDLLKEFNIIN